MKTINLKTGFSAGIHIDMTKVDPSQADKNGRQVIGSIDVQSAREEVEIARQNGAQVVWAATEIEKSMESIISHHLFDPIGIHPSRDFFGKEILGSSFFGFAPKKELMKKIVNQRDLLISKDKNRLGSALKTVMDRRNAFAHGNITSMTNQGCLLQYFAGDQKEDLLSDEYWDALEVAFSDAKELLSKASLKLFEQLMNPPERV